MKSVIVASLVAAAAASAATFLLAAAARPPAPAPAPDPSIAALRAALDETRRELEALRSTAGTAPAIPPAAAAPGGAAPAPAEGAAGEEARVRSGTFPAEQPAIAMEEVEEEPARPEEPSHISREPELVEKIRGMGQWDDRAELRSRWILVPEESIVHAFGKPDFIYMNESGEENWNYRVRSGTTDEDGNQDWTEVTLVMNRGRLIRTYD